MSTEHDIQQAQDCTTYEATGSRQEQRLSRTPQLTWKHALPAIAPLSIFLVFLTTGRLALRPDTPAIGLLAPGVLVLIATFLLADWSTARFRRTTQYEARIVWSRQALRNGLLCNILYTFLTQGKFSFFEFLTAMFFNYMGTMMEEYVGKASATNAWQQLKDTVKTFVVLLVLSVFVPSALSLDGVLAFLTSAYRRACFTAAMDFTIETAAVPFANSKQRLLALGLVILQGVVCIILLLPTPFFQNLAAGGASCPSRWTGLIYSYLCHSKVQLNDPLALQKQIACNHDAGSGATMLQAQTSLQESADYVARTCGGAMIDFIQLRSCQTSKLVEAYGESCPTQAIPYVKAAAECARRTTRTHSYAAYYDDLLDLMAAVRGRRTQTAGFDLDAGSQGLLMGALPRDILQSEKYVLNMKEIWTAKYM